MSIERRLNRLEDRLRPMKTPAVKVGGRCILPASGVRVDAEEVVIVKMLADETLWEEI